MYDSCDLDYLKEVLQRGRDEDSQMVRVDIEEFDALLRWVDKAYDFIEELYEDSKREREEEESEQ